MLYFWRIPSFGVLKVPSMKWDIWGYLWFGIDFDIDQWMIWKYTRKVTFQWSICHDRRWESVLGVFPDAQLYQIHEFILPTSVLNSKRWESYDSIFILRRFRLSGLTMINGEVARNMNARWGMIRKAMILRLSWNVTIQLSSRG